MDFFMEVPLRFCTGMIVTLISSLFCVGKEVTEVRGKPYCVITDLNSFISLLVFVILHRFADLEQKYLSWSLRWKKTSVIQSM